MTTIKLFIDKSLLFRIKSYKILPHIQVAGSTKDAGKRPLLPFRKCTPRYQPFSRFLLTSTRSPTFSSSSYSLFGGYATMHRNLKRVKGLLVTIWELLIVSSSTLTFLSLGDDVPTTPHFDHWTNS